MTHIEINKILRLQKIQSMFKIKETLKTAIEAVAEILKDKDLNLTEINHPICAAAMVVTKEVNGTGCYKSETHNPKTSLSVRCIQESINGFSTDILALGEIKRDEMKTQNMKRK